MRAALRDAGAALRDAGAAVRPVWRKERPRPGLDPQERSSDSAPVSFQAISEGPERRGVCDTRYLCF